MGLFIQPLFVSKLAVCLVQKTLDGNDAPLVGAFADLTCFVVGGNLEGDDLALYGSDFCFCPNFQTHGGGGEVGDVQFRSHGGLVLIQTLRNRLAGGTFHQCHHTGCGIDQQGAGSDLSGSILFFNKGRNLALHSNNDFHGNSSLVCWLQYRPLGGFCQERD